MNEVKFDSKLFLEVRKQILTVQGVAAAIQLAHRAFARDDSAKLSRYCKIGKGRCLELLHVDENIVACTCDRRFIENNGVLHGDTHITHNNAIATDRIDVTVSQDVFSITTLADNSLLSRDHGYIKSYGNYLDCTRVHIFESTAKPFHCAEALENILIDVKKIKQNVIDFAKEAGAFVPRKSDKQFREVLIRQ